MHPFIPRGTRDPESMALTGDAQVFYRCAKCGRGPLAHTKEGLGFAGWVFAILGGSTTIAGVALAALWFCKLLP